MLWDLGGWPFGVAPSAHCVADPGPGLAGRRRRLPRQRGGAGCACPRPEGSSPAPSLPTALTALLTFSSPKGSGWNITQGAIFQAHFPEPRRRRSEMGRAPMCVVLSPHGVGAGSSGEDVGRGLLMVLGETLHFFVCLQVLVRDREQSQGLDGGLSPSLPRPPSPLVQPPSPCHTPLRQPQSRAPS